MAAVALVERSWFAQFESAVLRRYDLPRAGRSAIEVRGNARMSTVRGSRRTCPAGHVYYKSSDCATCPRCEAARRPTSGFLSTLVAPARRALEREGIVTLADLAERSEAELLALHGVGPSTLPKLRAALAEAGLHFRD